MRLTKDHKKLGGLAALGAALVYASSKGMLKLPGSTPPPAPPPSPFAPSSPLNPHDVTNVGPWAAW